ncbi:MAG: GIY-YIG nuclease family protein [Hungatella sp.]|jgi:putative endonuclease|nr:GIY-YIG nuclease family protein [Hungatella sp.]
MNYVYLVRCIDGSLYCGWTKELKERVKAHNQGKGAKYTRSRRPVELVYYEEFSTKMEAMSREYAIKQMNRKEKLKLVEGFQKPNDPVGLEQ